MHFNSVNYIALGILCTVTYIYELCGANFLKETLYQNGVPPLFHDHLHNSEVDFRQK